MRHQQRQAAMVKELAFGVAVNGHVGRELGEVFKANSIKEQAGVPNGLPAVLTRFDAGSIICRST